MTARRLLQVSHLSLPAWGALLIGLQCIYLILELAFNARLVDSVVVADPNYFEYLSHVGRLLSGAGCTLLVFSLMRSWKTASRGLKLSGHILATVIAFPVVYYGQEETIDSLVENSTAEQRMHAQHISLLKRGLATNVVVFKDIEFEPEDIERPAARTFINTIGFSVFFAPDYIRHVVQNSDPILRHLAERQANDLLPEVYAEYLNAREQIAELSNQYNKANEAHQRRTSEIGKQAQVIWKDVYLELKSQWEESGKSGSSVSLSEAFDLLYDRLDLYFIARNRCDGHSRAACLQRVNQEYNEQIHASFGQHVVPEYWCKPIPGRTNRVMQGGRFVETQLAGGLDCSSQHRDFIRKQFLKLQGVSSIGYDSFEAFVASTEVAKQLRSRLAEKSIRMPEGYLLTSHEGFVKGVGSELNRQLVEAFASEAEAQFGISLLPGLTSDAFLEHRLVQNPLKQALGIESRNDPVALDLSERSFRDEVLIPRIEQTLAVERARLMAQTGYFADGEPYEAEGKLYVRSVLIPPVAMGLSMFFGLLNLSSLLVILFNKLGLPQRVASRGRIVFLALIVIGPVVFSSQIAQTAPFQKIVEETQESLGFGRYFVVWVTSLQPLVYPLGETFADVFGLFNSEKVKQP